MDSNDDKTVDKSDENITAEAVSLEDVLGGERPWEDKELSKAIALKTRRHYIDLLRMVGYNPFAISRMLGIPDTNVRRDIRALEKEEAKGELAEIRKQKRGELSKKLQQIITKAEEHRKSALSSREETVNKSETVMKGGKDKKGKKSGTVETKKTDEKREFAPNIHEANNALKLQLDAVGRIVGIYGLDIKVNEHTGEDGGPIEYKNTTDPRILAVLEKYNENDLDEEITQRTGSTEQSEGGTEGS